MPSPSFLSRSRPRRVGTLPASLRGSARLRFSAFLLLLGALTLALVFVAESAATANPAAEPMTTPEHIRAAAWWPTKPVADASQFAGSAACQRCHADLYRTQITSQMAHTLKHADPAAVRPSELHTTWRLGDYTYSLHPGKEALEMHVAGKGSEQTRATMQWVFGSGDVGQSFLWSTPDGFRESRFNYFASLDRFDSTPGRMHGTPLDLDIALGRPIAHFEARTCFACHTSFVSADLKTVAAGVGCESCHGPGQAHIRAMDAKAAAPTTAKLDTHIVNADNMTPVQQIDMCGACHSTSWDVRIMGAVGQQTVRFPAYRLQKSRCWISTHDERLVCTGCHNPHEPLEKRDIAYDDACLACHTSKDHPAKDVAHIAAACPVSTTRCVSCHMPRTELPEMHARFIDHNIRIVKNDAAFPD